MSAVQLQILKTEVLSLAKLYAVILKCLAAHLNAVLMLKMRLLDKLHQK